MYDDLGYAQRRLNSSLIRDEAGDPFWVREVDIDADGDFICIGEIYGPRAGRKTVKLNKVNLNPVPLGFVNLPDGGGMVFTCRKPVRRPRQGLSNEALVVTGEAAGGFSFKHLVQPIFNTYPSWGAALRLSKDRPSVAFSRDFGLKGEEIFYRGHRVGRVVDSLPILDDKMFFLGESLKLSAGM